ncbi:DND1 protein, partial [Amia calva]|nr:DND1 protein [Amia calva]
LNQESVSSLNAWIEKTGVSLVQINGQRKYGGPPPDWDGPAPSAGCEVFISQIPRDILYEFRLMMNFSGQNRGFAYAKYGDSQSALVAIKMLNHYELQRGCHIAVRRSTEKRQLCLGELPGHVDKDQLLLIVRELSEGVENLSLKPGPKGSESSDVIIHYASHHAASMAKKVLCEGFKMVYGIPVSVKWLNQTAKPKAPNGKEKQALPCSPFMPAKPALPPAVEMPKPSALLTAASILSSEGPGAPGPLFSPVIARRAPCRDAKQHHFQMNERANRAPIDAVGLLRQLCIGCQLGSPRYDMQFLYTSADGFQYFRYRVVIPGLPSPFTGEVHILPGALATVREEVKLSAAEEVLNLLSQG